MHFVHVVGARPNFMKISPVIRALASYEDIRQTLVHTGQHYDSALSARFFEDLEIPAPDVNLGVGSAAPGAQLGHMLIALEPVLEDLRPDRVLVVGDVTSTLAAALVASRLEVPLAHIEAGLRSGDWSMPEEVNRVLTDRLSDLLFTTEPSAIANLEGEGIDRERICPVGNVMIDTLDRFLPAAEALDTPGQMGVTPDAYVLATLHRPHNVDAPDVLAAWLDALGRVAADGYPVVFPVHPRTEARIEAAGLQARLIPLRARAPLGYLEFLGLMRHAAAIVTDSGGVQEEATVLGVPCLTLRPSTERPITISEGSNRLFTHAPTELPATLRGLIARGAAPHRPTGWDGHAAERIARILVESADRSSVVLSIRDPS